MQWYNTGAGADLKTWRAVTNTGGTLVFETVLDNYSAATGRFALSANGDATVISPGLLGYSTGAGGTVTQVTSKVTAVTLHKPTGLITTAADALAAGATAAFFVTDNLVAAKDVPIVMVVNNGNYEARVYNVITGGFYVKLQNTSAGSLSEAVQITFVVIKGANS